MVIDVGPWLAIPSCHANLRDHTLQDLTQNRSQPMEFNEEKKWTNQLKTKTILKYSMNIMKHIGMGLDYTMLAAIHYTTPLVNQPSHWLQGLIGSRTQTTYLALAWDPSREGAGAPRGAHGHRSATAALVWPPWSTGGCCIRSPPMATARPIHWMGSVILTPKRLSSWGSKSATIFEKQAPPYIIKYPSLSHNCRKA